MKKKHPKRTGTQSSHKHTHHHSPRHKKTSHSGGSHPQRIIRPSSPSRNNIIVGEMRIGGNGNGYIRRVPADPHTEIEIGSAFLHTALHNDEVEVRLLSRVSGGKPQGEVTKILHRNKSQFVGILHKNHGALFVVADDHRMYRDIHVDPKTARGINPGTKVLAEITDWDSDEEDPVGMIVQAIGKPGDHDTEIRAIALDRGFDGLFPKDVEAEARTIPPISDKDFVGRRDFRKTLTFTIDPKDAKDFDDALSWQKLPNGNYEIGIHIADVSHYVKPGTALDREAARRATSVYLVDRTIPMLPERLSNDLCSLKPHVDRLTFSTVFEITPTGGIVGDWYGKGVIHSAHRFTYEEAQEVIEGRSQELKEAVLSLNELAQIFRTRRVAEGAVEFQSQEVRCELGPHGKVLRIYKKTLKDANKLIEEFMLLANRKVTEWVSRHVPEESQVFVYRIHGEPNADKMRDLEEFVHTLGIKTQKSGTHITGRDINAMLLQVEHMAEKSYVHIASIRAMAKAIYSTKNIGHFGLGFQHYTHFTSPIRRYPDTMVHRLLDRYLRNEKVSTKELANHERMARYSTEMEISAAEAERASIRYKQVEYWAERPGAVWNGKISGVAPWGIFVEEEETGTEGMIHINDLDDDLYTYEETKHRMVGSRDKKVFRLGDPIRARIRTVDQKKRLIGLFFEKTP